ncbi:outer membrane protein assembly factor BamA [Roseitranquillus sediminis]|uniref:outer membrane protein assembly factor BamA n=1 Tax=Roseitranquillus sediminis TaxID=2809051 RepID=UPI003873A1B5
MRALSGRVGGAGAPLALAALLFGLVLGWVPPPAAAQGFSFGSVAIEGNQRIEDATILEYLDIGSGQAVSGGDLNAAYQRLINSGLFETVEITPRSGTLVVEVVERPTINAIAIEGNRQIDDERILTVVQSQPRRVFSPSLAEQDAQRIAEAYRVSGRLAATVEPRIIRRQGNRVDLVFEVTEGRIVENERISFVGNRAYSDRRLRRVLETSQAGLLRRLIQSDTFVAERIEVDRQLLRDFYQSRGYVDFRILDVTTELARERDATFITFVVQEGQSFDFGVITAASEVPGVDAADYLAVSRIRPGQTYSPTAVENTIARMERLATQRGLDFIRVEPVVSRDDRNLELDIEFRISRGPRVFVERIDIEGNQTTLDRVIRREFRTVEGDPFNPREIRAAAERIRALNYFANVDVNAREGSSSNQVVVDVDVEEQPTGSLSFGASYSDESGLGFALSFSERNFLGRGQTLRFEVNTGVDNASSRITFIEPYVLSRDLRFRFDAFYATTDRDNSYYDTEVVGVSPSINFPISENGRLTLRYSISRDTIDDIDEDSSPILLEEEGTLWTSAVGYTFTYDTRRTGLNPNAGFLFSFGQDFAGVGGDNQYIKTTAELTGQTLVWNEEVTLRATIEGGALTMIDGDSRVTDRFFLSSRQLRGFESRGVGPRDLNVDNDDVLGGNYYAAARFETEFPLGLPDEYGVTGGAFLDFGSVWSLDDVDGGSDGDDGDELLDDEFALRSAVGLSLFWDTPLGPLRFNFSTPLIKEEYDEERNFAFTFSTRF